VTGLLRLDSPLAENRWQSGQARAEAPAAALCCRPGLVAFTRLQITARVPSAEPLRGGCLWVSVLRHHGECFQPGQASLTPWPGPTLIVPGTLPRCSSLTPGRGSALPAGGAAARFTCVREGEVADRTGIDPCLCFLEGPFRGTPASQAREGEVRQGLMYFRRRQAPQGW
jgi:hypothetical protein